MRRPLQQTQGRRRHVPPIFVGKPRWIPRIERWNPRKSLWRFYFSGELAKYLTFLIFSTGDIWVLVFGGVRSKNYCKISLNIRKLVSLYSFKLRITPNICQKVGRLGFFLRKHVHFSILENTFCTSFGDLFGLLWNECSVIRRDRFGPWMVSISEPVGATECSNWIIVFLHIGILLIILIYWENMLLESLILLYYYRILIDTNHIIMG